MSQASRTTKQEDGSPPGVTKLAWPLIALGIVLLLLALFFSLYPPVARLPSDEAHGNCSIEFTAAGARPESKSPSSQSADIEMLSQPGIQAEDEAQAEFVFASFNGQGLPGPTPVQTPEAEQKRGKRKGIRRVFDWLRGKSSKEPVEYPAKRRPSPPKLNASTYTVTLCPGKESAARIEITASGFNPSCPPLAYHWRVDGGRIEGRGAKVVWNLWGLPTGKYRATFRADLNPDCYDCRDCDVFGSTKVTVRSCPTATPTPTPQPTPTPKPTPTSKPTPAAYICPNVYCSTVAHGNTMTFTAQASGGTPGVSPIYRWSVSAGRITGGQGTSSIRVDTTGLGQGTEIKATVEARGYGRICVTSCQSSVNFLSTPTPTPTPTPSPSPSPSPSTSPDDFKERQVVSLHYPKQLTKGQDATISFKWTKTYAQAGEASDARLSSAPRLIPASLLQTADEQSAGDVATIHLHSNDLNPKTWSLQLPLGEERSLTISPAHYAGQSAFKLEIDSLEVGGVVWKSANSWLRFWGEEAGKGECGARGFVISVLTPPLPSPYIPTALLLGGIIALLAGDYLRRMRQAAALRQLEETLLAESKQSMTPAAGATEGDEVRCTVFAPTEARQGKSFMVIAFAHLAEQAALLADMAKGMSKSVEQRGPGKKLGARIERGEELLFSLEMPGLEIDEPNQSLTWEGEPDSVQFGVTVPKEFETGSIIGTVRVAYKSVPIGHVKFEFEIVEGATPAEKPAAVAAPAAALTAPAATTPVAFDKFVKYRQVFISYASQDRAEVLKRVQVMSMMKLNFFQDLLTLEPGDDWEKTIYQYLDRSDAVFLFWSSHAKTSEWVEKELRYVINRREDAPEIVPIIIEVPPPLPPPDYLKSLHFNDKIMYLIKMEEESRKEAQPDK
jgi:hypothetical protein